jgi:hypothetical protein
VNTTKHKINFTSTSVVLLANEHVTHTKFTHVLTNTTEHHCKCTGAAGQGCTLPNHTDIAHSLTWRPRELPAGERGEEARLPSLLCELAQGCSCESSCRQCALAPMAPAHRCLHPSACTSSVTYPLSYLITHEQCSQPCEKAPLASNNTHSEEQASHRRQQEDYEDTAVKKVGQCGYCECW